MLRLAGAYALFYAAYSAVRYTNLARISTRGDHTLWVVVAPDGADDSSMSNARKRLAKTGLDVQLVSAQQFSERPIASSPAARVAVIKVGTHISEQDWSNNVDKLVLRIDSVDIQCSKRLALELDRACSWSQRTT
jgi:hypothetical protein